MFIKLCGFTRIEDIEKVTDLPVSAAGFIFYKKSRRYVTPQLAGEMALLLRENGIKAAGVFVDDDPEAIMEIVKSAGLDIVQVYSSITANRLFSLIPVIECVRISGRSQPLFPEPLPEGMVLFDTYSSDSHGGTGKSFNRELIRDYPFRDKMIVSGGVNEGNVKNIIKELRPGGIDISTGIEISEGIKSREKILKIMEAIKEAENDINA